MDHRIKNALRLARQFGGPAPMSSQPPPQSMGNNPSDASLIPYLRPSGTMPQQQSPQTQQSSMQTPMGAPPPMASMPPMGMQNQPQMMMPTPMSMGQMSGSHPMAMAHGGSVEDALRLAHLRLHRDDGGEVPEEVPQEQSQEQPDYEKASQFEQQQLQSDEPQLPQMDREAYNRWKYGAANALHGMAYLHPATSPLMGAYDLGHGAVTGNPTEMASSMFGLPSRVAKAIATASFAHQPESEGASPAARLATVAKDRMAKGGEVNDALRLARAPSHLNFQYAKQGPYRTELGIEEPVFREWVSKYKVPFNPDEDKPDYDMRGYYKAMVTGDPRAETSINPNDNAPHYPDTWKTPMHHSFSAESQYATPDAPRWNQDDQLVDRTGAVVFDERMPERKRGGEVEDALRLADYYHHSFRKR